MNGQNPRQITFRVLLRRENEGEFVERLLDQELAKASLSAPDRSLAQELAYGIVRRQATLDWLISRKTQGRTQRAGLRILLQLGLYQMFWLGRIPDHAAVHETVELAKRVGFGSQSGFINAVLRGYTREREQTARRLDELKTTQPALGHSHPEWLVERWQTRWGREKAIQLLEWNNSPPNTYARVNTLKTDAAKLAGQWRSEGVRFIPRKWDWIEHNVIFELLEHPPVNTLPSFQQGLFYIQDPSTLLSVHELDPHPNETVLDFCSAPGGKTTYTAQLMQNRGRILAQDIDPERLKLVKENCVRLGVVCVHYAGVAEPEAAPATIGNPQFDRILVDAPCSNTGVLRRRVDLRWRIRPEEIRRLHDTQLGILRQVAGRLKPGGVLVYSTCSLEPEENGGVVEAFTGEHPQFRLERERLLLPFNDDVDGAYVARLRKT